MEFTPEFTQWLLANFKDAYVNVDKYAISTCLSRITIDDITCFCITQRQQTDFMSKIHGYFVDRPFKIWDDDSPAACKNKGKWRDEYGFNTPEEAILCYTKFHEINLISYDPKY